MMGKKRAFAAAIAVAMFTGAVSGTTFVSVSDNRGDYAGAVVPLYEKFEMTVSLGGDTYSNPFDPGVIDIEAHFLEPGTGVEYVTWGFWYQDYDRSWSTGEVLTAVGGPGWKVRFAPVAAGQWRYYLAAEDAVGQARWPASGYVTFDAVGGDNRGFLRVAENNDYLQFDDGSAFLGIGPDVCWPSGIYEETYAYDYYLDQFAEYGCNFTRVWILNALMGRDKWIFNIQDMELGGDYDLADAWRVDHLLERARDKGVYIMWCVEACPGEFESSKWGENLYNVVNGGPCEQTCDFVTDETAKMYFRRVLRYLVARYGWNTNLAVWEFWNEFHEMEWHCDHYDKQAFFDWHAGMGQYLDSIDCYGRLLTTSMGSYDAYPGLWSLEEMDVAQMHAYGWMSWNHDEIGKDMYELISFYSRGQVHGASDFGKPQFFSEFGIEQGLVDADSDSVHLHNGLWAGLMSRVAVLPATWWWEKLVGKDSAWEHYLALSRFVEGVDFDEMDFERQRFDNCSSDWRLRMLGMRAGRERLYWIQNRQNNWYDVVVNGIMPSTVPAGTDITIRDVPAGQYTLQWWDTYAGEVVTTETVPADSRGLTFALPVAVSRDIGLKISGGPFADLNGDGRVSFYDFGIFAGYWLEPDCGDCGGGDLDGDGGVDGDDLEEFASQWLAGIEIDGGMIEEICVDGQSWGSDEGGVDLEWVHRVGAGEDRMLIVGLAAEESSAGDLGVVSVICEGRAMERLAGAAEMVSSSGTYMATELFYVLAPDVGENVIEVTYAGDVGYKVGGAVSLFNVAQQAPEAVSSNSTTGANSIATAVTSVNEESWIVDVVGCGNAGVFSIDNSEMMTQWQGSIGNTMSAVCSVMSTTFGNQYWMKWEHSGANRIAHSVAVLTAANRR